MDTVLLLPFTLVFFVIWMIVYRKRASNTEIELQEVRNTVRNCNIECNSLREQEKRLKKKVRDATLTIDCLQSRMDQMENALALSEVRIADLESQTGHPLPPTNAVHNGILLWKIEYFQRKWQDAVKGVKTALCSPPFYSAQYGYKMCAMIFLNGDGFGKGSHLSLFFVVMRGKLITYDLIV